MESDPEAAILRPHPILNWRVRKGVSVKFVPAFVVLLLVVVPGAAMARSHGGGHHASGDGHVYGFSTSRCNSASCYREHPNGSYKHPLTTRKHR